MTANDPRNRPSALHQAEESTGLSTHTHAQAGVSLEEKTVLAHGGSAETGCGSDRYLGRTLDDKYRLDRLLGQGGMGSVYLATHVGTERLVAVKLITPQFMRNADSVERFKREARAAGRLRHPNIVDVTDFGFARVDEQSVAYLVMEYLDGCTLRDVLVEEKRLPLPWVVDLLEQIGSAVQEAHRQGIVHRDLKPDNIWLEPNRLGGYRAKVLDFGIAKLTENTGDTLRTERPRLDTLDAVRPAVRIEPETAGHGFVDPELATVVAPSVRPLSGGLERGAGGSGVETASLTGVGSILGTPVYMSPEQCRGEALDFRGDIYSLGVVAYQMLCGQPPFAGDAAAVIRAHLHDDPKPLRERNRSIPKRISRVVMSALDKDPALRPQSMTAFASALRANADGLGVLYRRAFALYCEYFPQILTLSLVAHLPVILLIVTASALRVMDPIWVGPGGIKPWVPIDVLRGAASFVTGSVISGVIALMVGQLAAAPLKPLELSRALGLLLRRWKPFLKTSVIAAWRITLGFILLVIPGALLLARYSLWAPVVLMEGLEGREALQRARVLGARSWSFIAVAVLFQFLLPVGVERALGRLVGVDKDAEWNIAIEIGSQLISLSSVFLLPLLAIVPALLYLKMRQLGGETSAEVVAPIESGEPGRQWERKIRTRQTTQRPYLAGS